MVRALRLVALLFLAACTQETAPPQAAAPAAPVAVQPPAGQWRAVLVAGDNTSPAFDNGVESLRAKLVAQGVRDVRLYSSNAARVDREHLARVANLRDGLKSADGEACLAFVTSHGAEEGILLRPERGLLPPALLDRLLIESCGAAPTVVIMSACHSGTFIDARMRKPNRVILTAAAIDRSSFGCGAGDRFTYYDRCLLQHFDGAVTWRELAEATRACVDAQEKSFGIKVPSLPQTFFGAAVADLRIPGR